MFGNIWNVFEITHVQFHVDGQSFVLTSWRCKLIAIQGMQWNITEGQVGEELP